MKFFWNNKKDLPKADKAKELAKAGEIARINKLKKEYKESITYHINGAIENGFFETQMTVNNQCLDILEKFRGDGYNVEVKYTDEFEKDDYPLVTIKW